MFVEWKNEYHQNVNITQDIVQMQYDSHQNAKDIFLRSRENCAKIHKGIMKLQITKATLKK